MTIESMNNQVDALDYKKLLEEANNAPEKKLNLVELDFDGDGEKDATVQMSDGDKEGTVEIFLDSNEEESVILDEKNFDAKHLKETVIELSELYDEVSSEVKLGIDKINGATIDRDSYDKFYNKILTAIRRPNFDRVSKTSIGTIDTPNGEKPLAMSASGLNFSGNFKFKVYVDGKNVGSFGLDRQSYSFPQLEAKISDIINAKIQAEKESQAPAEKMTLAEAKELSKTGEIKNLHTYTGDTFRFENKYGKITFVEGGEVVSNDASKIRWFKKGFYEVTTGEGANKKIELYEKGENVATADKQIIWNGEGNYTVINHSTSAKKAMQAKTAPKQAQTTPAPEANQNNAEEETKTVESTTAPATTPEIVQSAETQGKTLTYEQAEEMAKNGEITNLVKIPNNTFAYVDADGNKILIEDGNVVLFGKEINGGVYSGEAPEIAQSAETQGKTLTYEQAEEMAKNGEITNLVKIPNNTFAYIDADGNKTLVEDGNVTLLGKEINGGVYSGEAPESMLRGNLEIKNLRKNEKGFKEFADKVSEQLSKRRPRNVKDVEVFIVELEGDNEVNMEVPITFSTKRIGQERGGIQVKVGELTSFFLRGGYDSSKFYKTLKEEVKKINNTPEETSLWDDVTSFLGFGSEDEAKEQTPAPEANQNSSEEETKTVESTNAPANQNSSEKKTKTVESTNTPVESTATPASQNNAAPTAPANQNSSEKKTKAVESTTAPVESTATPAQAPETSQNNTFQAPADVAQVTVGGNNTPSNSPAQTPAETVAKVSEKTETDFDVFPSYVKDGLDYFKVNGFNEKEFYDEIFATLEGVNNNIKDLIDSSNLKGQDLSNVLSVSISDTFINSIIAENKKPQPDRDKIISFIKYAGEEKFSKLVEQFDTASKATQELEDKYGISIADSIKLLSNSNYAIKDTHDSSDKLVNKILSLYIEEKLGADSRTVREYLKALASKAPINAKDVINQIKPTYEEITKLKFFKNEVFNLDPEIIYGEPKCIEFAKKIDGYYLEIIGYNEEQKSNGLKFYLMGFYEGVKLLQAEVDNNFASSDEQILEDLVLAEVFDTFYTSNGHRLTASDLGDISADIDISDISGSLDKVYSKLRDAVVVKLLGKYNIPVKDSVSDSEGLYIGEVYDQAGISNLEFFGDAQNNLLKDFEQILSWAVDEINSYNQKNGTDFDSSILLGSNKYILGPANIDGSVSSEEEIRDEITTALNRAFSKKIVGTHTDSIKSEKITKPGSNGKGNIDELDIISRKNIFSDLKKYLDMFNSKYNFNIMLSLVFEGDADNINTQYYEKAETKERLKVCEQAMKVFNELFGSSERSKYLDHKVIFAMLADLKTNSAQIDISNVEESIINSAINNIKSNLSITKGIGMDTVLDNITTADGLKKGLISLENREVLVSAHSTLTLYVFDKLKLIYSSNAKIDFDYNLPPIGNIKGKALAQILDNGKLISESDMEGAIWSIVLFARYEALKGSENKDVYKEIYKNKDIDVRERINIIETLIITTYFDNDKFNFQECKELISLGRINVSNYKREDFIVAVAKYMFNKIALEDNISKEDYNSGIAKLSSLGNTRLSELDTLYDKVKKIFEDSDKTFGFKSYFENKDSLTMEEAQINGDNYEYMASGVYSYSYKGYRGQDVYVVINNGKNILPTGATEVYLIDKYSAYAYKDSNGNYALIDRKGKDLFAGLDVVSYSKLSLFNSTTIEYKDSNGKEGEIDLSK